MADFKTHITTSTILGGVYGGIAYLGFDMAPQDCLIAAGLCSYAGMLPDLDSSSGVPVRETLCFLSAVVPMLMVRRFADMNMTPETMVLTAGLLYVGIRFGLGEIFKRYTVHRGMWHSIPAAMIAGGVAFLVCVSQDFSVRIFKSWAVVLGFLSHLILDELYSVDLGGKVVRVKKSFGTAMKFYRNNWWANVSCYGKLILVGLLVASDPTVAAKFDRQPLNIQFVARDWIWEQLGYSDSDASNDDTDDANPNDSPTMLR